MDKLNLSLDAVKKVGSIIGGIILSGAVVYNFVGTLATKSQLAELKIELRIKDIESSLFLYNQQDLTKLDNFSKQRYNRLLKLLETYEDKSLKVQGISDDDE